MTKEQFYDEITCFEELIDFCREYSCDLCDNIITDVELSDCVDNDIQEALRYDMWYEIRDALSEIATEGYEYIRRDGPFEYVGLDDYEFEEYKDEVANWAEDDGIFDEDDEDERDEEEQPVESVDEQDEELCDEVSFEEFSALLCEAV